MSEITVTVTPHQKELIAKAIGAYSQFFLGQTVSEQREAKKLVAALTKSKMPTVNLIDLCEQNSSQNS